MDEDVIKYFFVLVAIMQGCFVLGFTLFIFGYYLPKKKTDLTGGIRWHVILVSLSYILLTSATIKTAAMGAYTWGDLWYWIVSAAYLSGDVSLVFVFREAVKKHRIEQLNNKQ